MIFLLQMSFDVLLYHQFKSAAIIDSLHAVNLQKNSCKICSQNGAWSEEPHTRWFRVRPSTPSEDTLSDSQLAKLWQEILEEKGDPTLQIVAQTQLLCFCMVGHRTLNLLLT